MAGLFPLSRMQQFDDNAELLIGARLFLFDGGTTTPRIGYRDSSLTSPHPNPIVADAAGRLPLIYIDDGFYRQRLTDASGVLVFDDDGIPVISTTTAGTGTSVDPNSTMKTRDIKIRFDDQPIDGYVRLNGKGIGSVAATGATERANSDTQPLYEELWVYPNIKMYDGNPKGSSGPGDFIANRALILPNCAGRGIFGMDDMGAGAQGVLTAATIANPTLVGSYGGSQQVTIAQGNLPVYTLTGGTSASFTVSGNTGSASHSHGVSGSGTTNTGGGSHSHTVQPFNQTGPGTSLAAGNAVGGAQPTAATSSVNIDHTHTFSFAGSSDSQSVGGLSFSWTGVAPNITIGSGGSGTATTNLPPVMLFMIYVRL